MFACVLPALADSAGFNEVLPAGAPGGFGRDDAHWKDPRLARTLEEPRFPINNGALSKIQLSSKLTSILEKSPPIGLLRSGGHHPTLFFARNPNLRAKMAQNLQNFKIKIQFFKIVIFSKFSKTC